MQMHMLVAVQALVVLSQSTCEKASRPSLEYSELADYAPLAANCKRKHLLNEGKGRDMQRCALTWLLLHTTSLQVLNELLFSDQQ